MCAVPTRVNDHRIELCVRRVDGSLQGSARDGTGNAREFTGWLGLLGALEALLAEPASMTEDT
jgi:hypothetical protein